MRDKRLKHKGRLSTAHYIKLTTDMLCSKEFRQLSPKAVKAFIQLASQYRGFNNGDLSLPRSRHAELGWNSAHTVAAALKELVQARFAVLARQGGKHQCSLYGLTIWKVDSCKGKLDAGVEATPIDLWKLRSGSPQLHQPGR
jgi:hypothetical protein